LTAARPLAEGTLAIDGTGCGRAVVDLFRQHPRLQVSCRPILITAGQAVSQDEHGYLHVAKVQLVSTLRVLTQSRRLKIAPTLKLARTVERELATFTAKITPAGSETFQADWRTKEHDDLILGVALAAFLGETTVCGLWEPSDDPDNRSLIDQMPPDV